MVRKVFFIVRSVADILFPRQCIICGRNLLANEKHICIWCMSDFPYTFFWTRRRNEMSEKFNLLLQKQIDSTSENKGQHIAYINACALYYYHSQSGYQRISQRLKYSHDISTGKVFSQLLGQKLASSPFFKSANYIIPVPLHWSRKYTRGYNQAEIIAKEVARSCSCICLKSLLIRKKRTQTQTKIGIKGKGENVKNAFMADQNTMNRIWKGEPLHFIVVDDVFTTGSTLLACRNAIVKCAEETGIPLSHLHISVATLGFVG